MENSIGPWIISGFALAQVWAISLYNKFRRPKFEFYPTGNLEIGFSTFGPTVGIIGTLRSLHKDIFIEKITVQITRAKDNSVHTLNWRAFRELSFSIDPSYTPRYEVASSFLLHSNAPSKHNIFFVDDSFISDINPKIEYITAQWITHRDNQLSNLPESLRDLDTSLIWDPLFTSFVDSGQATAAYAELDRAFYWTEGDYELRILTKAHHQKKEIVLNHYFHLSKIDVENLRLNSVSIVRSLCGVPFHFKFANPQFINK